MKDKRPRHDLTGQKFGTLTAIKRGESIIDGSGCSKTVWICKCDCGNEQTVETRYLKRDSMNRTCFNHPKDKILTNS